MKLLLAVIAAGLFVDVVMAEGTVIKEKQQNGLKSGKYIDAKKTIRRELGPKEREKLLKGLDALSAKEAIKTTNTLK